MEARWKKNMPSWCRSVPRGKSFLIKFFLLTKIVCNFEQPGSVAFLKVLLKKGIYLPAKRLIEIPRNSLKKKSVVSESPTVVWDLLVYYQLIRVEWKKISVNKSSKRWKQHFLCNLIVLFAIPVNNFLHSQWQYHTILLAASSSPARLCHLVRISEADFSLFVLLLWWH